MPQASDHESIWGQRFAKLPTSSVVEGRRCHVYLSETGTVGDTRPGILLAASDCELDREQARRLAEMLLSFAETGRLPPPEGKS